MINVTKTFLPPLEEYKTIVSRAWDNAWLTNRGVLVEELEGNIKEYLGVKNVIATANGTLPIQIAIKTLKLEGEIITTPFSYVATTSSIVWENCKPIFVDIHPDFLTIDETKIEEAITKNTSAILATHVFGNPCNVVEIEKIAKKYNLKVIYDAAHCFGVKINNKSVFEYGNISTCSFHATKIFHTGEGGAMITTDNSLYDRLFKSHNFGHVTPESFNDVGINAKMSELQAAMGLAVFPYFQDILEKRKELVQIYDDELSFNGVRRFSLRPGAEWNYSYYAVIFDSEKQLVSILNLLQANQIFPRRYFYPSLNNLSYVSGSEMPISESISKRVLCLPLYHDLLTSEVFKICDLINRSV